MTQTAFRHNTPGYAPSKKAVPRQRGQAAMSMYYTMQEKNILLFVSPSGSLTCRANFVISCGSSVRAGAAALLQMKGVVKTALSSHSPTDRGGEDERIYS